MNNDKNVRLVNNAIAGTVQAIISGLVLIITFRLLLDYLGAAGLGQWSLWMAFFGIASVADIGLSGAGMKLTAEALLNHRFNEARNFSRLAIYGTGAATLGGIWIFIAIIPSLYPVSTINSAVILVMGLGMWINFINQAMRSLLDAFQRTDLRHFTIILQALHMLVSCFLFVPSYGLIGLAIAYFLSVSLTSMIIGTMLWRLWLKIPQGDQSLSIFSLARKMFRYGLPFQITTISGQLYDPVTKYLLAVFGSIADVAWYEMASRLVLLIRSLLISATEAIAPYVAGGAQVNKAVIESIYLKAVMRLLIIGMPLAIALIISAPIIAFVWTGTMPLHLILFIQILTVGWAINAISAPAYFCSLGQGHQKWNLIAHFITAILNLGLGSFFGFIGGVYGVVLASVLALIAGSVIQIVGFNHHNNMRYLPLKPMASDLKLWSVVIIGLTVVMAWWNVPDDMRWYVSCLGLALAVIMIMIPLSYKVLRSDIGALMSGCKKG